MLEQQAYVGLTCQDLKYPTAEYVLSQCKALAFWTGLGEVPGFSSSGEVLGSHKAQKYENNCPNESSLQHIAFVVVDIARAEKNATGTIDL